MLQLKKHQWKVELLRLKHRALSYHAGSKLK
jgi:hypothetical protein